MQIVKAVNLEQNRKEATWWKAGGCRVTRHDIS